MEQTLKVGSKVIWRGAWGTQPPIETTIESMELCESGVCGEDITECTKDNYINCVFGLANGHWCYGHQIDWEDSIKLNK